MDSSSALTLSKQRASEAGTPRQAAAVGNPFRLRPAALEDASALEEIEREAFPTLFPPTRFSRELRRDNAEYLVAVRAWSSEELKSRPPVTPEEEQSERNGRPGWLRSALGWLFFTRFVTGRNRPKEYIAGMVGLWFVLDEAHVVIIGARPRDRRRGVGELLLIGAIEAAMRRNSRVVTLEVRESNTAARALYRKYGFRDVGLRKRYYADNNEDAVIMTTPPIQSEEYWSHFQSLTRSHAGRWGRSVRLLS